MHIAIGSDHAGFEQKEQLKAYLQAKGYTVTDCGSADDSRVDYPDFATKVAHEVTQGTANFGVLVCGTGIGMAMAAGKCAGIRAANVITPQFAQLAREHNDANVITLSGRFVDVETNKNILDVFLATPFAGGRHAGRVEKINNLD